MDFKTMLEELRKRGQVVNVALPAFGVVSVTISSISDDVVTLERMAPAQKILLHYASVIVIT